MTQWLYCLSSEQRALDLIATVPGIKTPGCESVSRIYDKCWELPKDQRLRFSTSLARWPTIGLLLCNR